MPTSRLIALIAGNFFVATSFMAVGGLLNEIAAALDISVERAGLLIAAFGVSAAICAPVLATLGSHIDRRKLLTASMAVCAIANIGSAFSQTYDQLLWARILAAVTSAVYTPQVAATVSMLVPENERAPTLGKLMVGWAIGSVVGNPLSVMIGSTFGWRMSFVFIGVASAVIAAFVWWSIPAGVRTPPLNLERWYQVFKSPALRWLTAATALTNVGGSVMFSFLAPIAKAVLDVSGAMLAALFFVSGVGGLIGNVLSVRMVRKVGAANVAYKCNVAAAAMMLVWPLAAGWLGAVFVVQFLWSLGGAGFPAVQQARLVAVAPLLAGATIALNSSVTYLGGSAGATIGATVWTLLPPRFIPWVGLLFIVAALVCSVRGEKAARELPPG